MKTKNLNLAIVLLLFGTIGGLLFATHNMGVRLVEIERRQTELSVRTSVIMASLGIQMIGQSEQTIELPE